MCLVPRLTVQMQACKVEGMIEIYARKSARSSRFPCPCQSPPHRRGLPGPALPLLTSCVLLSLPRKGYGGDAPCHRRGGFILLGYGGRPFPDPPLSVGGAPFYQLNAGLLDQAEPTAMALRRSVALA